MSIRKCFFLLKASLSRISISSCDYCQWWLTYLTWKERAMVSKVPSTITAVSVTMFRKFPTTRSFNFWPWEILREWYFLNTVARIISSCHHVIMSWSTNDKSLYPAPAMERQKVMEARYRTSRCLPCCSPLWLDNSSTISSPPKNIAKGPLVRNGIFPVRI